MPSFIEHTSARAERVMLTNLCSKGLLPNPSAFPDSASLRLCLQRLGSVLAGAIEYYGKGHNQLFHISLHVSCLDLIFKNDGHLPYLTLLKQT